MNNPNNKADKCKELTPKDEVNNFLIYSSPDGNVKVEAFLHNENIWLT